MQLIWFGVGAVMGSAANALIDRLPRRESWIHGRSKCDKCKHELGWRDLVPIVAYLELGGRCRYCHSPIPCRNLLVEIFMGAGWALLAPQWVLMGVLWVTTVIAVMDWETRLVSEVMVGLWGMLVFAYQFSTINLLGLLVGVAVIGGIWAVSRGKAMGFGDVEMAAVMGWWLGWPKIGPGLWVAFVAGAVVGSWKLIVGKARWKSEIAFGPFLVVGAWAAYIWGDKLWSWVFPY